MSDAILISPTETKPAMISSALATSIMISPALAQAQSVPTRSLGSPLWDLAGRVPSLDLNFAQNRSLVDATTGLNLITFSRTSDATFVDSNGLIQTASAGTPRFDHSPITGESLGLLVEEQRTNSIRNNTMVGAAAGTPGTLPTNWLVSSSQGLTTEVSAVGTSAGINYVDLRISGTPSGSPYVFTFDNSSAAAAPSQTWTISSWFARVAGSETNISGIQLRMRTYTSGSVFIAQSDSSNLAVTTALTRQAHNYASLPANTAVIEPAFRILLTAGQAIDITLRIGLPQLEQGAFATSVIPTSGTAVTRAADVASISGSNFSSWYRQDEGTVFADAVSDQANGGTRFPMMLQGSTFNERMVVGVASTNQYQTFYANNSVVQASLTTGTYTPSTRFRMSSAYATNDIAQAVNGGSSQTDTSATLILSTQLFIGFAAAYFGGTIRRLTYWPARLSNNVLQELTR